MNSIIYFHDSLSERIFLEIFNNFIGILCVIRLEFLKYRI